MIKIKRGASIEGCRAEILQALILVDPIYTRYGADTVVTSGSEKYKHSAKRSAHYRGDAVDLRIKHVNTARQVQITKAITKKLGADFVVLYEGRGKPWAHVHIHHSPIYHD